MGSNNGSDTTTLRSNDTNNETHHHHHHHHHRHHHHRHTNDQATTSTGIYRTSSGQSGQSVVSAAPSLASSASASTITTAADAAPSMSDSFTTSMTSSITLEEHTNVTNSQTNLGNNVTEDTEMRSATPVGDSFPLNTQNTIGPVLPTDMGPANGDEQLGVWAGDSTATTPTIEEQQQQQRQRQRQQQQQPQQTLQNQPSPAEPILQNTQNQNNTFRQHQRDSPIISPPRLFMNGKLIPREEDIIWSLEILAFVSKYTYLRDELQSTHLLPKLTINPESVYKKNVRIREASSSESDEQSFEAMEIDEDPSSGSTQQRSYESTHVNYIDTDDDDDESTCDDHWNYDTYDFESIQDIDEDFKGPIKNIFSLVELFTTKQFSHEIQYWAGVIMRNSCRKDETKGGIRQCASFECGRWESYPRQFAKCRRCKRTKYCSKGCQLKAWSYHRYWCLATDHSSRSVASSSTSFSQQSASSSSLQQSSPSQQQSQQQQQQHASQQTQNQNQHSYDHNHDQSENNNEHPHDHDHDHPA